MELSTDSLWLMASLPLILIVILHAIHTDRTWEIVACGALLAVIAIIAAVETLDDSLTHYEHNLKLIHAFGFVAYSALCFVLAYLQSKKFQPPEP